MSSFAARNMSVSAIKAMPLLAEGSGAKLYERPILDTSWEVNMRGASSVVLLACFLIIASWESYAEPYSFLDLPVPVGARVSHHDLKAMTAATQPLLDDDSLPIGTTREWSNPESGDHGTVQLLRRFEYEYQGSKLPCREITYHIQVTGSADPYNYKLNRCKVADGSWKTL
jgi:surface antigen